MLALARPGCVHVVHLILRGLRALLGQMYGRTLSSIPEKSELEEEQAVTKWVPKKKHEILKAKYKCLKKLFQIYDASLINILPEPYVKPEEKPQQKEHKSPKKRRKTHRHRTDACEGTAASSDCRTTTDSDKDCSFVADALLKDLKIKKCAFGPTMIDQVIASEAKTRVISIRSQSEGCLSTEGTLTIDDSTSLRREVNYTQTSNYALSQPAPAQDPRLLQRCAYAAPVPLTRMQILKYRLLGRRPKNSYRYGLDLPQYIQTLSDPAFSNSFPERGVRPRRRLRLRRNHKPRLVRSNNEISENPMILNYVQSVQRNCLLDTTPRHCPFPGCKMLLNGIINYNDHLRLCHFPERKFVCHYCHEGFETEHEKLRHENEHIGIGKIQNCLTNTNTPFAATTDKEPPTLKEKDISQDHDKTVQCDVVSEEKLKKIVSYFDKIATGDGSFDLTRRFSEESRSCHNGRCCERPKSSNYCCRSFGKPSRSDIFRDRNSEHIHLSCKMCGEMFQFRKELNTHMDSVHKVHKYSKFHSFCALPVKTPISTIDCNVQDGQLNVESLQSCEAKPSDKDKCQLSKSALSVDYDPSTNIVYYHTTSMESICNKKGASAFDKFVKKVKSVRSTNSALKWEPGTKVIHV